MLTQHKTKWLKSLFSASPAGLYFEDKLLLTKRSYFVSTERYNRPPPKKNGTMVPKTKKLNQNAAQTVCCLWGK
jgi:hypothetical protein